MIFLNKKVMIHMCMEATLGISLYSYLYLKQAKMLCLSYYLFCFFFNKIREQEGGTGSSQKEDREVAQTMYIHVSKYKNDKIKKIFLKLTEKWNMTLLPTKKKKEERRKDRDVLRGGERPFPLLPCPTESMDL
jgi:hypothetical protein